MTTNRSETAVRQVRRRKAHEGEFKLTGSAKIETAGIYDIDMDFYHGDCCVGHSVSGTDVWVIEDKSLRHYHAQSFLSPQRTRKKSSAMERGKAAHYLQLGETRFKHDFVIKPWPAFSDDVKRKWRDEHEEAGFSIITEAELGVIRAMAKELASDPICAIAFADGRPEMTIAWQDEDTGIWCKTRPDWLPSTSAITPNFKTAADGKPAEWSRKNLYKFGYHVKEAMRVDGMRAIGRACTPYFIVQETSYPYVVTPIAVTAIDIQRGRLIYKAALRKLAKALKEGVFPGYTDSRQSSTAVATAHMPAYMATEFEARYAAGEFAGLAGEARGKPL